MQTASALLVLSLDFADFNYTNHQETYNANNQEGLFAYAADSMQKHRDGRAFFKRDSQRGPRCRSPPLLNLAPEPKFRRNGGVPNGIQLRPRET